MIAQLDQSFAFRRSLVPVEFETFLAEPAFSLEETTFCIWRRYVDTAWRVGSINYPDADDPDGSEYLLSILDGRPSIYKEFAESYYEKKLDIDAIEQIYHLEILTTKIISGLNGEITLQSLTSGRGGRGSRSVPSGGQSYRWDAEVKDDWVDPMILSRFSDLLSRVGRSRRFTHIDLGGQDCLIGCATAQERERLSRETGLKVEWLK